jgi:thymidine phosphorylase
MVAALGGPADFLDKADEYLPRAPVTRAVHADGVVGSVDTRAIGNAIIELGGGRRQVGEALDLSVGFSDIAPVGARLGTDRPLAVIHSASDADAEIAKKNLLAAVTLVDEEAAERPVVCEILTG